MLICKKKKCVSCDIFVRGVVPNLDLFEGVVFYFVTVYKIK